MNIFQSGNRTLFSAVFLSAFVISLIWIPGLSASEYLSIEEIQQLYPKQVEIGKSFKRRVNGKGVPISPSIQKRPVKIAFIYPGNQVSDYWKRSVVSFSRRMDEIGVRYEIIDFFSNSGDIRVQEGQLRKALSATPDYLVYTLDVNRHKRLVERLISKGSPKIILQNITTPLKSWKNKQPFFYVGFDHARGTRMLAERIQSKLPEGGGYTVLFYSRGYVSEMRGNTFIQFMEGNPRWHLVDSYYTNGKRKMAKRAALEILQNKNVKLIYACSTDVAFGALDAIHDTDMKERVILNGWGGGSEELQAVLAGDLDLTVMRINDDNGVAMAEAIRLDLEGKEDAIPMIFSGDFAIIDGNTTEKELHSLKERSFRYSGTK